MGGAGRAGRAGQALRPDGGGAPARSHRPQDYYGQPHFVPETGDSRALLALNRARCAARAAELAAAAAFTGADGECTREDLLQVLNRMSSMLYILMIRQKAGR